MTNQIAVLSGKNISDTIDWIRSNFPIREIRGSSRRIILDSGTVIIVFIIDDLIHGIEGYEFSSYIKAPNFANVTSSENELEDRIKLRVR